MSEALWLDALLAAGVLAILAFLGRTVPLSMPNLGRTRPRYYPALARQAGVAPDPFFLSYWGLKVLLAVLLPLLAGELLGRLPGLLEGLAPAVLGFLLPDLVLLVRRRRRQERIRQSLSYFLDLLVSLLRSGLGLEEAFRRAGRHGFAGPHPLAQEVARVGEEVAVGRERGVAFRALAERTGVSDLQAVAAALELGTRLGTPLGEILANQADLQRHKRLERGRRRIQRAAVMALFPVFLCGYPLFLVLAVFPAIVELSATFQLLRALLGP